MFRNMVTSLLKYKRIQTTDAKAKVVSQWADHLITLAKRGDLHSRRQALSIVREKKVVHQLFEEANDQYGERLGGHTRIIKIGYRAGDAARLSVIELIGKAKDDEKETKKKKVEADKKEEVIEKKAPADKEKKTTAKTKKSVEPKKKEAAKKKSASKKKVTQEKKKKASSSEEKKDKAAGKKKAVRAKKKAAPKKVKEKKEK
jgi:large subunit ribosomal protein L17